MVTDGNNRAGPSEADGNHEHDVKHQNGSK